MRRGQRPSLAPLRSPQGVLFDVREMKVARGTQSSATVGTVAATGGAGRAANGWQAVKANPRPNLLAAAATRILDRRTEGTGQLSHRKAGVRDRQAVYDGTPSARAVEMQALIPASDASSPRSSERPRATVVGPAVRQPRASRAPPTQADALPLPPRPPSRGPLRRHPPEPKPRVVLRRLFRVVLATHDDRRRVRW
jgi:hypothetical protein